MAITRPLNFRSAVAVVLGAAALVYLLFALFSTPGTDELSAKVSALELQIQQLKANYNAAAPRDSIVNLKTQLNTLQYRISRHEAALEASKQADSATGEESSNYEQIVSAAQRDISSLRDEMARLQKAYQELEEQNSLEHKSLLDEHQELEELNAIQHMDHEHEHIKEKQQKEASTSEQIPQDKPVSQGMTIYPSLGSDTVLLIVCHNRAEYLSRTLNGIAKYHPKSNIPIVISQDGNDPSVVATIEHFKNRFHQLAHLVPVVHIQHTKQLRRGLNGYYYLADHYKYALDAIFHGDAKLPVGHPPVQRVIILEEDLDISPDFFEYFAAVAPILDRDTSLLAASAWNDNGMKGFVKDNTALYRSDFFPGLGWMIVKQMWEELSVKWPAAYWDDWMRHPAQRQGRQTIRPEVCRTYHFGIKGTSNSQFSQFLTNIQLNEEFVPFTTMDLDYLEQANWDDFYLNQVRAAPLATVSDYKRKCETGRQVRIEYEGSADFESTARRVGVMDNVKAEVPRTAYQGVVSFWSGECKVHLAPTNL